jgi:NADH:ubiquinone oxidoreductase subunit 2 (subunit N)
VSLVAFLAIASVGAVASLAFRGRRWAGTLVGIGAVAASLLALVVATPDAAVVVGGGAVALTAYARLLLGVALAGGLGVLVVGRLAAWEQAAPGVLLLAAAGSGLALGVAGALPALLAAGATATLAAAAALARPATPPRVRALAREVRGAVTAMTIGVLAVSLLPEEIGGLAVQSQVAGLAMLAAGIALGHRFGVIPLHARVARLTDVAPPSTLPALLVLLPATWAVIFLAWAPDTLGPVEPVLGWDGALLVALGLATMLLGTFAALIQDDIERIVAYTIVLDAGVVILGFAALDPAARDAVRAWLLPFLATRTALVGWTIAFRAAFGTTRLSEARGWLRRAPALGAALVGIGAAAVGWPGVMVWDARVTVFQAATGGLALLLASLAGLGTAVALARVFGAGFGRPEPRVVTAAGELARVPAGLRAAARAVRSPGRRRASVRAASHELRPLLELNRTPLRALLVVLLAGLSIMTAAGAFGIREAGAAPDLAVPAQAEPAP